MKIVLDSIPENCGECELSYRNRNVLDSSPLRCDYLRPCTRIDATVRHRDCPLEVRGGECFLELS